MKKKNFNLNRKIAIKKNSNGDIFQETDISQKL